MERCPICDKPLPASPWRGLENGSMLGHHCSLSVLRAIESANTRAENRSESDIYVAHHWDRETWLGIRLRDGFAMLHGDDEELELW